MILHDRGPAGSVSQLTGPSCLAVLPIRKIGPQGAAETEATDSKLRSMIMDQSELCNPP